jgi:hypothetical protein
MAFCGTLLHFASPFSLAKRPALPLTATKDLSRHSANFGLAGIALSFLDTKKAQGHEGNEMLFHR